MTCGFDLYLSRLEDAAMREPEDECPACGHFADLEQRWCRECRVEKATRIRRRAVRIGERSATRRRWRT